MDWWDCGDLGRESLEALLDESRQFHEPGTARPGEVPGARLIMGWLLQLMARARRYNYI